MKISLLLLFAIFVQATPGFAKVTRLSGVDRKNLEQATPLLVRSMREIPHTVIKACASFSSERNFRLADPGERFQVTDAILPNEANLPGSRLIWAAKLSSYYLMHYESGGYGHTFRFLLVAVDERKARVTWAAGAKGAMKNYPEFLAALKSDELFDNLDFGR